VKRVHRRLKPDYYQRQLCTAYTGWGSPRLAQQAFLSAVALCVIQGGWMSKKSPTGIEHLLGPCFIGALRLLSNQEFDFTYIDGFVYWVCLGPWGLPELHLHE
jgi:hypothetical protein